jgi:hypothetical protein
MDLKRFFEPEPDFTDLSSSIPTLFTDSIRSPDVHYAQPNISGSANSSIGGTYTDGVNPFPYIGDPIPPLKPATVTIGTATTTSYPLTTSIPSVLQPWTPPLGALGDFFNVQYLSVEAVCAVTGRALKPGEPVLVLDEHIISKAAFMKLLREGFERMMFRVEEMHEMTGYDS